MLASCFDQRTTNSRRCSMGDVSFQGTNPPRVRTVGVTHALGPFCYPCARLVPPVSYPLRGYMTGLIPLRSYTTGVLGVVVQRKGDEHNPTRADADPPDPVVV